MIRVVVVGSGGVAEGLARWVVRCTPHALVQVYGRNRLRVGELSRRFELCESDVLQPADLYILAVSDDAVASVAEGLPISEGSVLVHTAGSIPMDVLRGAARARGARIGVLYPMQSFTPGRELDLSQVPLFVEGEDRATTDMIAEFAKRLSSRVVEMSSEQRCRLHLSAVFASNFANAMFSACGELLSDAGLTFDLYGPLIEETVGKALSTADPRMVQTGPAKRGDHRTMDRHLEMLAGDENKLEMYKIISKYIWETSKKI